MVAAAVAEAPIPRGPQSLSHHFCPFFQKPLSAGATVQLATRSPEQARAGDLSSQGRRALLRPPKPTTLADRVVWGNSSTNALSQPEM